MKIVAHIDNRELEELKSQLNEVDEHMGRIATLMDSITEHIWNMKHTSAPLWFEMLEEESEKLEEEREEDDLHG